jgi:hypothetical protein
MSVLQIRLEEISPTQFGGKLCPFNNRNKVEINNIKNSYASHMLLK